MQKISIPAAAAEPAPVPIHPFVMIYPAQKIESCGQTGVVMIRERGYLFGLEVTAFAYLESP
jgi:hypothetical protein